ncbi:MAG: ATP-dependent DNA ligase [Pseudomonadota bacterium]
MKRFTELYLRLDQSNATNDKLEALTDYLREAPPADAAWAVYFLSGRRLKRLLKRADLKQWALDASGYPEWVLAETYEAVGDLAETIALLLPDRDTSSGPANDDRCLRNWIEERLIPLGREPEETQGQRLKTWWATQSADERFVLNKLMTGALRVGVSQKLVTRALAQHFDTEPALIAQRMMGDWEPTAEFFAFLETGDGLEQNLAAPYPFFLAAPLEQVPTELGDASDWQAEWKWDGIRAQIIRRQGDIAIWSRGEERLDARFPEIEAALGQLPDGTVLDGEILGFLGDAPEPRYTFAALQPRIGRKKPSARILESHPVEFMAYDLLELGGVDCRELPLAERRKRLAELLATTHGELKLSPVVNADDWSALTAAREQSRERGVEGLMLKEKASAYGVGRQRGSWWKWKVEPYTVDAVLLYAQPGSGRRSNLFTDYTFGVWQDGQLVTLCKAYSGLDNAEIRELDRWIRGNTLERFGPVRAVPAVHVFEIGFEAIWPSKRHKAGFALRFPRILRWRRDLAPADAEQLVDVARLAGAAED